MALVIKDEKVHALARELAERRGTSLEAWHIRLIDRDTAPTPHDCRVP